MSELKVFTTDLFLNKKKKEKKKLEKYGNGFEYMNHIFRDFIVLFSVFRNIRIYILNGDGGMRSV